MIGPGDVRRWLCVAVLAGLSAHLLHCRETSGGDGDSDVDADVDEAACPDLDPPLGGECAPVEQLCCERGERCTVGPDPEAGDELRELCRPGGGDAPHGTVCSDAGDDGCGAGTTCLEHPLVSYCARFCAGSRDCPAAPETTCVGLETTGNVYNVCVPVYTGCDPVARTGCTEGYACVLEVHPANTTTACFPAGSHAVGEVCSDGAGCAPGAGCYEGPEAALCLEYCSIGEACADGTDCLSIGNAVYGVCLPPA